MVFLPLSHPVLCMRKLKLKELNNLPKSPASKVVEPESELRHQVYHHPGSQGTNQVEGLLVNLLF